MHVMALHGLRRQCHSHSHWVRSSWNTTLPALAFPPLVLASGAKMQRAFEGLCRVHVGTDSQMMKVCPKGKREIRKADSEHLYLCCPVAGKVYQCFRKTVLLNKQSCDFVMLILLKQILLLPQLISLSPGLCSCKCWQLPISRALVS